MASTKLTAAAVTPLTSVSATLAPIVMATKNKTCSKDFRLRIGLREKEEK